MDNERRRSAGIAASYSSKSTGAEALVLFRPELLQELHFPYGVSVFGVSHTIRFTLLLPLRRLLPACPLRLPLV